MTNITFLGQSSFLMETKGKTLLFDPMISFDKAGPEYQVNTLQPDYMLISHGHSDHLADAEAIGKASASTIISSFEVVSWFSTKGLKGHPMNIGGKFSFDFGQVKYVSAVHSSVLPDGTYGGPAGGFVIWNDDVSFYFAGDTALTMDMKLIPLTCPKLDFAILPLGDNFTMGYEDAVLAADFIACDHIIGCHYDTFDLIKLDHQKALETFEKAGKKLILPEIGKTFSI